MRVFIADGNSTARLALQMYMQQEPGVYVTGMASEADGLVVQIEASQPDVLLLDSHLPGASMPELLKDIRGVEAPPKIVILSLDPDVSDLALSAGAEAFVYKKAPPDELIKQVRLLRGTMASSSNG